MKVKTKKVQDELRPEYDFDSLKRVQVCNLIPDISP